MTSRVTFSATAVYDDDGGLLGVEMDCLACGEDGWKGPDAMDEHARTHLDDAHRLRWPMAVIISRQMLDHLEAEAGLGRD